MEAFKEEEKKENTKRKNENWHDFVERVSSSASSQD
jgi:hypothetical protein